MVPKKKPLAMRKIAILKGLANMDEVVVESGNYVNISNKSESLLGKRLNMNYPRTISTLCGKAGSIKNFLDYMIKPSYPIEYLSKKYLTDEDYKNIGTETIDIPNYWAVVAYILTQRVLQDPELQEMLIKNELMFVSFKETINKTLFNTKIHVGIPNLRMSYYVAIVRKISAMLKDGSFNTKTAKELVLACLTDTTKGVFTGTPIELKVYA